MGSSHTAAGPTECRCPKPPTSPTRETFPALDG
ncbi:hypothetical protein ABID26_005585 [Mesorhizobium shonense]|uniref:Propionyl-coenzyme A carboxylase alpha polypeptide n=1 Tax=Mesorhizobium shonense TaxID=1209948 RepID=A0ABV2HZZ9_9HYPH